MQLWFKYSKKNEKKKFTIVPAINILTTPEERERFKNADEDHKVMIIINELYRSIEELAKANHLGCCIIRQVIVDGEVWKRNYVCELSRCYF